MIKRFEGSLESLLHDYDGMQFIPSGDFLLVEGTSIGTLKGKTWEGGKTSGSRFCNVFKFRDNLIVSVHVYLDSDYTCEDEVCFRWEKNGTGNFRRGCPKSKTLKTINNFQGFFINYISVKTLLEDIFH
jgi:hypothetical protein